MNESILVSEVRLLRQELQRQRTFGEGQTLDLIIADTDTHTNAYGWSCFQAIGGDAVINSVITTKGTLSTITVPDGAVYYLPCTSMDLTSGKLAMFQQSRV